MKGLFILAIDTTLCALWKLEGRESRQRSNCTIALVKRSDCGDLLEVKSRTTAIAGGVVSSIKIVFRTLNTSPGVVGGQRTSANRDKLCDSRPAVHSPFIVCSLNGASTCIIVWIVVVCYTPICVHLLNCHFYISSLFHR